MLSSLFAATTCLAILVSDPLEVPAQVDDPDVSIAVGTYVTPTSFRSHNFSAVEHKLVFAVEGAGEPVVVSLPPGGSVRYEFAPEALAGMKLEVVAVEGQQLTTTGTHPLVLPTDWPDMNLWTVPGTPRLYMWRQLGCDVTFLEPQGTLLPPGSEGGSSAAMSAPHVPVTVPRTRIGTGSEPYSPI